MSDERPSPRGGGTRRRRRASAPVSGTNKGQQLREILEGLVATGAPGDQLPSERVLADRHGVARMTVRGVIDQLVRDGLVHRVHGQGTFVSEPRIAQSSSLTSFSEDMATRGMVPSSIVLAQEVVPAPAAIALSLELPAGEEIVRIKRIRLGDGDPIALEHTHLPARRFPGLEEVDLTDRSLYVVLSHEYGCALGTSEQRIAAVALRDADAHLLHTDADTPALRIERVTRDARGAPIELVRSIYRGDRFELHTEQHRAPALDRPQGAGTSPSSSPS